MRALVVGDVMTDIIVRQEGPLAIGADRRAKIVARPGGSGANQAAWLAHFGVKARFIGRVGAANYEEETAVLAKAGVEAHLTADAMRETGRLIALIDRAGERSFFTDRGANDGLAPSDIPDALIDDVDHVHVSGYCFVAEGPRQTAIDLIARAKTRNVPTSVDPASTEFLREIGPSNFLLWTAGVDIFFPNEDEARVLTRAGDSNEALARLATRYPLVALKRGAAGALAAEGAKRWRADPPKVGAIDTTGAGDAFLAGFLAARLGGSSIEACLQRANEAGAAATLVLGGRP
ncbi:MAG TPA: PfkB family carbohydrate kinase [Roseiarcus sp.]|nr:PfkB family carbohydrate kinase [Roseiarcus sp.]